MTSEDSLRDEAGHAAAQRSTLIQEEANLALERDEAARAHDWNRLRSLDDRSATLRVALTLAETRVAKSKPPEEPAA